VKVQGMRSAVRINLSLGLVFVSLIAELLFVLLIGYGLYRVVELVR
jgi:hypothetical protein